MKILPVNQKIFCGRKYNPKSITFKGFDCPEDSFEIKRVYNLPCPVCGYTMVQQSQIDSFVSACEHATGDELINLLSKYKKYFHETEQRVAEILIFEASMYPNDDILQLSSQYLREYAEKMKAEQLRMISEIRKYAGKLNSHEKVQIEALIEKYTYIVQNENEKFSKNDLEREIIAVLPSYHSSRRKIQNQIKKLPTINDDEYRFLKRYGEKSKAELASKLLTPALATCEHIKPKSSGGKNNTENYLAQCQECNSTRNDTPFKTWISGKFGVVDNLTKYIRLVAGKIESGEISSDYVDYPSDIARTISTETTGKVKLEVPSIELSQNAVKLNFEAKIAQLKKSIEDLKADLEKAQKLQVKSKNSEQFRLYCRYVELQKEKNSYTAQRQKLIQSRKNVTNAINNYYSSVIELRDLQRKISTIPNPKDVEKARNKIASLQKYISTTKVEEKETEADNLSIQIGQLTEKLANIERELRELTPKINFSSQLQKEINDVKVEIFELTGLLEKMSHKRVILEQMQECKNTAEALEAGIKELCEENAKLNPNDDDGENIDEYRKMCLLTSRSDELSEKLQKTLGKEYLDVDSKIFEFAKQTALGKIQELMQKSEAVRHYMNLEEIERISKELKQIYAKIEQFKIQLQEFDEIQALIDSKKSLQELNSELSSLNIRLAGAKEVEESVDIEQRIRALEDEIKRKSAILEKIEHKEMSEEDFIKIFSEV